MKKLYLLIICAAFSIVTHAQYSGSGNGTESDPYLIYNETQLYQMNNFLGDSHTGVVFKLMKDLDLSEFISDNFPSEGWIPVGVESTPFMGKFYGNNHKVSGLWIDRKSTDNVGFFGYLSNATIKDFSLESTHIYGGSYVGTLAGYATATIIENCNVQGYGSENVRGTYVGGFAGKIESSTMRTCSATIQVLGSNYAGGLVGQANESTVVDCDTYGDITASNNVGGICGNTNGVITISQCNYKGDITASTNVGGIVGNLASGSSVTFTNSHSKGKISNSGDYTGGIVGISNGGCIAGMEDCSHFGDISGKNYVGGLVGGISTNNTDAEHIYISTSSISNSKRESKQTIDFVTGTDESLINNCTAIGNITGQSYIGGLIGWDEKAFGCSDWKQGGASSIIGRGYNDMYLWFGDIYTESKIHTYSSNDNHYWSPNIRINTIAYTNSYYSGIINGTDNVGGIAGYKWCGRIQNCYTNATVYGCKNVGGIIGNAEGYSSSVLTLKSDVAINNTISATVDDVGRIYGKRNDYVTIGALASSEGNRALTTTKVIKQGVVQEVTDDFQNGNVMGQSLLKLKANYVALGWNFDENWEILETECFPYKKYQAAPPVIESSLVSQNTEISGSSLNGGTVFLYYKDRKAVSTNCSGNNWTFKTDALQSGAPVQLYADVDGMTPSYLTSTTVSYPGSGTEADPYRIYTAEDLQGACNRGYYKLMNDIDLSTWINENSPTKGWISIGRNSGEVTYINGNGHKVTGLWIDTTEDYTGLFSNFSAGIIKNLTVEVADGKKVKGGDYTGILIGRNANGQLLNCAVKGDVEGTCHVGGVTGYSGNNTVNMVSFEGKVTSSADDAYVGGFAGVSENDAIAEVHSCATISAIGTNNYIGGAIGCMNGGTITKSHAENSMVATGTNDYVGGLIGYSKGEISLSYSTGAVTASAEDSYTGGLVGYAFTPIVNCYSTVKTTGTYYTAGLCAYTHSTIDKCYAKGDVYGSRYGGGVVAQLDGTNAALTNSIAINNILDLTDQAAWGCRVIGGFKNGAAEPNTSNYALSTMQVSLNGVAQKKTDDAVEGIAKTEAELMSSNTYAVLQWDLNKVWNISDGESYPTLYWETYVEPVVDVTLDKNTIVLLSGTVATLTATVTPLDATNKQLKWTSNNTAVATVDNGVVTAVGTGSTTITATTLDGSNITVSCKVTVVEDNTTTDITTLPICLYADSLAIRQGGTAIIPVKLKNNKEVTAFQCNILLPDGIVPTKDKRGNVSVTYPVSDDRLDASTHTLSAAMRGDTLVVLCYSTNVYDILGEDGVVFDLEVAVPEDMPLGNYVLQIKKQNISGSDMSHNDVECVTSTITIVEPYILGDVNDDGTINVYDIVALANYIVNGNGDINVNAADYNEDGEVNVYDIVAISSYILGK